MNTRMWRHDGLTPSRETAQSRSMLKDVASHFLQRTCIKDFSISIVWQGFDHDSGMVVSLSYTSKDHPCVAP